VNSRKFVHMFLNTLWIGWLIGLLTSLAVNFSVYETYLSPFKVWLPIGVFTEFIDFLTLGLRIYGVIFAGEMLLKMIGGIAFSGGIVNMIVAIPLALIWQGFSVFLGSIQAFVFVTLTSVYISHKVEDE